MEAANVVRMRVKPGCEKEFLETQAKASSEGWEGFRGAYLVRLGDGEFCFVGEWDSLEALAARRPAMVAELDRVRHLLADRGEGMGVTDPASGEIVLRLGGPAAR